MRRAFLVNSDKCIGCRGCAMACKSFNQLEPERYWRNGKRKLTAVCSHQTRIGNLDAHLI